MRCFRLMPKVLCIATTCSVSLVQPVLSQGSTNQFRFNDYLVAPIRVHLLSAKDSPSIQTSLVEADINRILGKLNVVWAQAGFHFYLESLVSEEANQSEIHAQMATLGERSSLLGLRPNSSLASNTFHIYYIKQMPMNGIYFEEGIFVKDSAALREVDGGIDEPLPRVSSHELGHALGLPHRQCVTNLMASGTTGTWLNAEEIRITREAARKLSWIQVAPELMKKAGSLFRANKISESARIYSSLATIPVQDPQVDLAKRRMTRARPTVSAKDP
jgi:hypothetical protein